MIWMHNIDPIIFSIGPLTVRWYGLAYASAFLLAYLWLRKVAQSKKINIDTEQVETLLFSVILGVLIGGRLGHFVFYDTATVFNDPLSILKIWQGGMSFHGGLAGVLLAVFLYSRKIKRSFLELTDLLTIPTAIGLFLGRIANFINGELWGRPTGGEWGVIFPSSGNRLLRHPSQIYEAMKNLVIFLILLITFQRKLKTGVLSCLFLVVYGIGRILVELLWRAPVDGFILGLPAGAFWSVPLVVIGIGGLVWLRCRK